MAIVQRFPADTPGDDIVDPVLRTEAAKIERGRQEINQYSSDRLIISGTAVRTGFVAPGTIVGIIDKTGQINGMLTGFSLRVSSSTNSVSVSSSITVESLYD